MPQKILLFCSVLFLFFTTPCLAIDVTLKWDASPGADYYVVHWGPSPGEYTDSVNVGNTTTGNLTVLDGVDSYIAVTAVNDEVESTFSREVCVLDNPDSREPGYDRGWAITDGDLKGFSVMYNSISDPNVTPTLGPSDDIPSIPGVNGAGLPLNLQTKPPGHLFTEEPKM